jgi:ABC-type taurine transport system ATPase subunit
VDRARADKQLSGDLLDLLIVQIADRVGIARLPTLWSGVAGCTGGVRIRMGIGRALAPDP